MTPEDIDSRPMRIGFLTYGLDRPLSGISRVAMELGSALHRSADCEVIFLRPYGDGPFSDGPGVSSFQLPGCSRLPGLMVLGGPLIAYAARQARLDLIHDPTGVCPFTIPAPWGRYRRVVTIHDAIAFRFPKGYPFLNNLLHRRYVPITVRNADAVITVSEYARADLTRFLSIPPERLHVVPNGVSDAFRPVPLDEARAVAARYGLTLPYILTVGNLQARKNLPALLAAFRTLDPSTVPHRLAIVGQPMWNDAGFGDMINRSGLGQRVVRTGYVNDSDLPAIYSAADFLVFPSLHEGFGLPIIEAMASGTPVITSNAASLPEVAGDAALTVDATDVRVLASAIERVASDPALRQTLRTRGLKRAEAFDWGSVAAKTIAVYRRLLRDRIPSV
jgi:glycosyltransferase involved in cell wall biosynthesis